MLVRWGMYGVIFVSRQQKREKKREMSPRFNPSTAYIQTNVSDHAVAQTIGLFPALFGVGVSEAKGA